MTFGRFKPPCSKCEDYKLCDSGTHRFFVAVVVIMAFISCGYSYLHSQSHINSIREQMTREMEEAARFKADIVYTTISDIGRYEEKASELMALRVADRIQREYNNNLSDLHDKFKAGTYSDPKFNKVVYDVTMNSNDSFVLPEVYHSGYMLFVKNKMLHNNLLTSGSFSFDMEEFASRSYNPFLSMDFINMIREHRTETMVIEPKRVNWVDNHVLIHSLTYDNIYSIIKDEDIVGLNGYYVVRPAYITKHGDIFNINDFDEVTGIVNSNFKISVVPYISLYEYLTNFRKRSIDAIKVIEEESRKRASIEERNAYYSSISSLLIYISAIFLILNLSNCLFYRNMVKQRDVEGIKSKLIDRV